ncbi:MAG: Asp-tRNA(Asn)/Glu-tRNA(Gln) amidotransferase subunit GatB [Deltaproteobacteria bacterium]|nr:Asp-tRNA(Asn)/Glu-tRNA(Gln) amidotransferase subunit GatB [Deltaproteobacteria bacterium]
MSAPGYEAVIGLEVHAQLLTKTKQFCGCPTTFGAEPNTNVCPVCLGLPGALPVLNHESVAMAVRTALALGCTIRERSIFARKNYFYPDLPKGYQISQYDLPFSEHGSLEIAAEGDPSVTRRVGITRVHLEEDAGKNLHGVAEVPGKSVIDLNRSGVPLMEIVGEPDLRGPAEAVDYLKRLRDILVALEVNDGNLEEGSFRCDVNISVRRKGSAAYGTRVEIKNVNSFRHVHRAIEHETARLVDLAESGQTFKQHTRQWDDESGRTVFLREKEGSDDYRYFPDPDLPPLVIDERWVGELRASIPELPAARRERLVRELKLPAKDAEVLTGHPKIGDYFEKVLQARPGDAAWAKRAANFVMTEVLADTRVHGLSIELPVTAAQLVELLSLVDAQTISGKQAKEVFAAIKGTAQSPEAYVGDKGMAQVSDAVAIEAICRALITANPKQVAAWKAGKKGIIGFFVGAVMKETKGSANPALLNEILERLLAE